MGHRGRGFLIAGLLPVLALVGVRAEPYAERPSDSAAPAVLRFLDLARASRPARSAFVLDAETPVLDAGALDTRALGVAAIVAQVGDPRLPSSAARAARLLAERFTGYRPPDARALQRGRRGEDVVRVGFPGGDLDGDGLDDSLSIEFRLSGENGGEWIAIRALRSTDAAELWAVDIAGAWDVWPLTGADLDADGADDILLYRLDVDSRAGDSACIGGCSGAAAVTTRTTATAISGPDGDEMWQRVAPDVVAAVSADVPPVFFPAGGGASVVAASTTGFPAVVGDQDGDGGDDVILNLYRFAWPYAAADAQASDDAAAWSGWAAPVVASRALVLSGADGSTLLERARDPQQSSGAVLLGVGDAVGDDTEDLLLQSDRVVETPLTCAFAGEPATCAGSRTYELNAEMIVGRSHATAWHRAIVDAEEDDQRTFAVLLPARADLDGDASSDLLLIEAVRTRTDTTIVQGAASGADGLLLWRARTGGEDEVPLAAVPIGPVGGGSGSDLLVGLIGAFDGAPAARLERRDGASGSLLFETAARLNENPDAVAVLLTIGGDADSDGTLDLVIDLPALDLDWERELSSVTRIESGRTGEDFFRRSTRGSVFSLPAGDLDDVPGDDLYLIHFEWLRRYGSDVTIFVIDGATGVVRWSRADAIPEERAFALIPSGDQTGDGRADAIYSRAHFHSEFEGFREFRVADASGICQGL